MRKVLAIVAIALAGALIAPPFASADELDDFLGWQPAKINQLPSQHTVPDLTKEDFNKSWSDAPKRNPSPAQKRGESSKIGGKFVGGAVAGLTAFTVGMDIGDGIAKVAGLPSTGSRACDFTQAIFNSGFGCSLAPAPDYVPNTDIMDFYVPPGWTSAPVATLEPYMPDVWFGRSAAKVTVLDLGLADDLLSLNPVLTYDFACLPSTTKDYPNYQQSLGTFDVYFHSQVDTQVDGQGLGFGATCVGAPYLEGAFKSRFTGWKIEQIDFKVREGGGFATKATWYPEGHPDRPEEMSPIPERAWVIEGQCMAGNPFSVSSGWFFEAGEWEPMPTIPCNPSSVTVKQKVAGYEDQIISTWNIPTEVQDWVNDNPDGSKELDLLRIGGTTERVSCFDDSTNCADWWMDPQKNQNFECRYGGQPVALSECNVYRPTFNPLQTTQGVRYADREGRLPEIKPTVVPGGVVLPESNGGECFPSGWGMLNPVEWVLKPTKCALSWAFVPKSQTMTNTLNTTKTLLMTKPPFSLVAPVGAVITGLGDGWGGECSGALGNFGMGMVVPCSPEDVGIAWNVARHVMNLGLIITTCFVLWRMFISALGAKGGDA